MKHSRKPVAAAVAPAGQRERTRNSATWLKPGGWGYLLTLMIATPVGAQSSAPAFPDTGASVLRVFGALLLVLALFFAGVWLFKNWQRLAARQNGATPKLNVLEVKSLGNRHALYVIGYDRRRMLVASSPTGMTLLSPLPEASEEEARAATANPAFADSLRKALGRKG